MKLYKLTDDEIKALKTKIVELFAKGLSRKEVFSQTGIDAGNLRTLMNRDYMFGHKVIKARGDNQYTLQVRGK